MAVLPLIAYLWRRDGFDKVGLIEEWTLYFTKWLGGALVPPPAAEHRLRPLSKLPQEVAWALTPDSFLGLNLVHATLFALKGIAAYALIRALAPRRARLALLTGALFVVWPADTGLFATRAMTPHFALVLFLVAATLLVRFVSVGGLATGFVMVAVVALSLLTHEIVLPLVLAFPALLLRRGLSRRHWLRLACWYPLPVAAATRLAYELTLGTGTYQRLKLQVVGAPELAMALGRAYLHLFVTPWGPAFANVYWPSVALAAAAALPLVLLASRTGDPVRTETEGVGTARLAFAGMGIAAMGFVPYLLTPLRALPYTTLYASSLGAALCVALACDAIARKLPRPRLVWAVVAAVVLILGLISARLQHEQYIRWSRLQQRILLDIAQQTGGELLPGTVVLLLGDSPAAASDWRFDERYPFFPPVAFRDSLRFVLGNYTAIPRLCYPFHPRRDAELWWSHWCELGPRGVSILNPALDPLVAEYGRVIAFSYDARTGTARLLEQLPPRYLADEAVPVSDYSPHRRMRASAGALHRATTLLRDPSPVRNEAQPVPRDVLIDFDVLPTGRGWDEGDLAREAGPAPLRSAPIPQHRLPPGFAGDATRAWTSSRTATLSVPLVAECDLEVELRVMHALSQQILDGLTLAVDGKPVALTRDAHPRGGTVFRAIVPAELRNPHAAVTSFALTVPYLLVPKTLGQGADERELGVLIDWFHVFVPATDAASSERGAGEAAGTRQPR